MFPGRGSKYSRPRWSDQGGGPGSTGKQVSHDSHMTANDPHMAATVVLLEVDLTE